MKIGIPEWQGRVSPVFDESRNLLLIDIENRQEVNRVKKRMLHKDPLLRAKHVMNAGVDILICGTISLALEHLLISDGIVVIAYTCGPVNDIVNAYINQTLMHSEFTLPGCRKKRQQLGI